MRPCVLGRKNWLFANTAEGTRASAAIFSTVETAKDDGENPLSCLTRLFRELPYAGKLFPYLPIHPRSHSIENGARGPEENGLESNKGLCCLDLLCCDKRGGMSVRYDALLGKVPRRKTTLTRLLLQNSHNWLDLYDTENLDSRLLRRSSRLLLLFYPWPLIRLGLVKHRIWPETLALLGLSALECEEYELATSACESLLHEASGDLYWGLPIDWHSGKDLFPAGTMMSTTTAEVALFMVDLDRCCQCVGDEILYRVAYSLLHRLYRVADDGNQLQFAYTPYPGDPVNNANLLVAAALWRIGCHIGCDDLRRYAERVAYTTFAGLDPSGGITYFRGYDIVDAYHQLFCLRSLYSMMEMGKEVKGWFWRAVSFFEDHFVDTKGGILVRTDKKRMYDMIASSEALRLYRMMGWHDRYSEVLQHIERDLVYRGRLVQRAWITSRGLVHARILLTRQGAARLALGLTP
jgi:hypothetical protein